MQGHIDAVTIDRGFTVCILKFLECIFYGVTINRSKLSFFLYLTQYLINSSYCFFSDQQVNLFNFITLILCFVHPIQLLITPLQKRFIRKERDIILKAKGGES